MAAGLFGSWEGWREKEGVLSSEATLTHVSSSTEPFTVQIVQTLKRNIANLTGVLDSSKGLQ